MRPLTPRPQPQRAGLLILFAVLVVVALAILLAACGTDPNQTTFGETEQDAGVSGRDDSPALVINMPNGYNNVAFKCHGGTGIYVTRNGDGRAMAVAANDPNCSGGASG